MSLKSITSIHTVTKQVQSVSRGDGGGTIRTWANVTTNMLCRVRPLPAEKFVELQREGMRIEYKVFFHYDPQVDERNRLLFTDSDGVQHILLVIETRNPHHMDRFWVVNCMENRDVDNVSA